jgi:hypothetical protein
MHFTNMWMSVTAVLRRKALNTDMKIIKSVACKDTLGCVNKWPQGILRKFWLGDSLEIFTWNIGKEEQLVWNLRH